MEAPLVAGNESLQCLTCDNEQVSRGLCSSCYQSAMRAINAGKVTDEELVTLGLIRPKQKKQSAWSRKFAATR